MSKRIWLVTENLNFLPKSKMAKSRYTSWLDLNCTDITNYKSFNCRGKTIADSKNENQRNSHVIENAMEKSVQLKSVYNKKVCTIKKCTTFSLLQIVLPSTNSFCSAINAVNVVNGVLQNIVLQNITNLASSLKTCTLRLY